MILQMLIVSAQILLVFNEEMLKTSKEIEHENTVSIFYTNEFVSSEYYTNKPNMIENKTNILQAFEDSLFLIFAQLYNYYASVFPAEKKVNNYCRTLKTNKSNVYELKIRKDYVLNICSHIFRCMDYLYVSSISRTAKLFNMYKSYGKLCISMQTFMTKKCVQSKVTDKAIIIICHVLKLRSMFINIEKFKKPPEKVCREYQENTVYQDTATKFMLSEYELMSDIDWTTTFSIASATYDIFNQTPSQDVLNKPIVRQQLLVQYDTIELEKVLKRYSIKYTNDISTTECAPVPITDQHETYILVGHLIIYTLQRLEQHLTFILKNSNKTKSRLNKDQIDQNVLRPFKKLCDFVPEILLYLFEHDPNCLTDTTLFSLYLSLCGNNMDFIVFRCPSKNDSELENKPLYQYKCTTKAIREKLLWNFYSRTGTILKEDEYTTNSTINNDCS
ncbi:Hypothetical protein CINCED_3A001488, partial [Cinara cedri]